MKSQVVNMLESEQEQEIHDIVESMREKAETIYRRDFHPNELEALWRKILIDWMTFVVDHCHLQRQAVAAAAFFLDIAMSNGLIESRQEHQLAAASSLQLALKLFDSTVIRIEKLVSLGRGLFTKEDVATMEFKILKTMNWHCHPPSTYCFLRQYERLLPHTMAESTRCMIDEITKVVVDLTISDHKYNYYSTSVIAYASMLLAMELLSYDDLPVRERQCFIMRMSTVSKVDSNSPHVMKAFESLKESLDTSSKLEDLLKSIRKVQNTKRGKESERDCLKSSSPSAKLQSPRDVMERIGCLSTNPSSASLTEMS